MGKTDNKGQAKTRKDIVQAKSGPGTIVKAKDKRKKPAILKKMKEKLGEEIRSANVEFTELQSKMVSEKENKQIENEKSKEKAASKVAFQPTVSQEKQVEDTTNVLANL